MALVDEDYLFTKHRSDEYPLTWIEGLKVFNEKLTPFGNTWTIPRKGSDAYYLVTNLLRTKLNTGRLSAENRRLKSEAELLNNNYVNPLKFYGRDTPSTPRTPSTAIMSTNTTPRQIDPFYADMMRLSPSERNLSPVSYASSRAATPVSQRRSRGTTPLSASDVSSVSSGTPFQDYREGKVEDMQEEEKKSEQGYASLLRKSPYSKSLAALDDLSLSPLSLTERFNKEILEDVARGNLPSFDDVVVPPAEKNAPQYNISEPLSVTPAKKKRYREQTKPAVPVQQKKQKESPTSRQLRYLGTDRGRVADYQVMGRGGRAGKYGGMAKRNMAFQAQKLTDSEQKSVDKRTKKIEQQEQKQAKKKEPVIGKAGQIKY